MLNTIHRLFLVIGVLFITSIGCNEYPSQSPETLEDEPSFSSFEILKANNPIISKDLTGYIDRENKIIRFRNPHIDINNLIGTFSVTNNSSIFVDEVIQKTNTTVNNYIKPVEFKLVSEDGVESIWTIESTREIVDLQDFLTTCPMDDPNIEAILSNFDIRLNGELVTEFPCQEPYFIMSDPTTEKLETEFYTETTRLQSLRFLYYLDYDNPVQLPWTDLRLYEWLNEKIGGINIVDGLIGGNCFGFRDGKFNINVGNIRTAPDNYIKSSEELLSGFKLLGFGLTLHERRHMDGSEFSHVFGCCENESTCDQELNLNNPSAFGLMVWWNKSIWDNTYNFGQSCAYKNDSFWSNNSKKRLNPNTWSGHFCSGPYSYDFPEIQQACSYE